MFDTLKSKHFWPILIFIVVLLSGLVVYGSRDRTLLKQAFVELQTLTTEKIAFLESTLLNKENENKNLSEALLAEQERNNEFEERIEKLAGSVGLLEKLQKTDPELLQKYSKVYFLNENYAPSDLSVIDESFVLDTNKTLEFHAKAMGQLERLLEEMEDDELDIKIASAYRSFTTQAALKSGYRSTYGSGANQFSADQGYSEHQLGTTVDFTTPKIRALLTTFENTPEFAWLQKNAYKYGFILSYPKGNTFYQYEPWHWRFVGKELATYLKDEGLNFYDVDQRAIDTYLANLFD